MSDYERKEHLTSAEALAYINSHTREEIFKRMEEDPVFANRLHWMNYNQEDMGEPKPSK